MPSGMDWERARRARQLAGPSAPKAPSGRGISNAQARELAQLQRAAGLPYTGSGMTAIAAARAIRDLKRVARPPSGHREDVTGR